MSVSERISGLVVPIGICGLTILCVSKLLQKRRNDIDESQVPAGTGLLIQDLRDPSIRGNHLEFNKKLMAEYPDADAIELDDRLDGHRVYLVHNPDRVSEVTNNHQSFTSNPWPGKRSVVTLNTMEKCDHDRVFRLIRKYYTPAAIASMEELIASVVEDHGKLLLADGDVYKYSKRLHMHLSLITSGVAPDTQSHSAIIDEFIAYNDNAVKITAPLGGVGPVVYFSFGVFWRLMLGLMKSVPGVVGLVRRIGLASTWHLLSPLEALFPSAPYTHIWEFPEDLPLIVKYFNRLYDFMANSPLDSPAGVLYARINLDITGAEALGTAVQLMVNMTTANAIQSLMFRKCFDNEVTTDNILKFDAPLQRNPRRALKDTSIGSVIIPKGSLVLLMVGAANLACHENMMAHTFGFGLHHCIGRHLVNLELKKIDEWIASHTETDTMSVVGSPVRLTNIDVGNWGFSRLFISFKPK